MSARRSAAPGRAWLIIAALLATASTAHAQPPSADWRVLETERYRIHFPAPAEQWTRRVAGQLKAERPRLEQAIGQRLEERTEVLVVDPLARPNGIAWPILGRPRMVLYLTPPPADSSLAHYRDWGRVLAVHEDAHLVHLSRRSRAPFWRLLERVVPAGPVARAAPLWAVEGYATLLEGRLTGWGRPSSDLRAAVLRAWARAGALPTYAELSGDRRRWLGLSAPYLVGSAFLEWLEERDSAPDRDALPDLWARLAARDADLRRFDEAFASVFGDTPRRLYGRFVAETTHRSMLVEEARADAVDPSELWLDLAWRSSAPSLSPDGERLAMVLRAPEAPSRLVVWSTSIDEEAVEREAERRRRARARDPELPVDVRRPPPPRRVLAELPSRHGAEPYHPRWTRDGRSLVFTRFEPDADGTLRADLFLWTPGAPTDRGSSERGVRRVTREADVREPAPGPDGRAIAVRHRHGFSSLVQVDLASGEVAPLAGPVGRPSVERVVSDPALSPSGERLAWVERDADGWSLRLLALDRPDDVRPQDVARAPLPDGASIASPAWSADGRRLFASLGVGGVYDLVALDVREPLGDATGRLVASPPRPVVRAPGGALAPAPTPDGSGIFFLALESDGLDLRRAPLAVERFASPAPPLETLADPLVGRLADRSLAPVLRRNAPASSGGCADAPNELSVTEQRPVVEAARDVRIGRIEHLPLLGGGRDAASGWLEIGLRSGDVLGRLDLLTLASVGDLEGGAVAGRWRGGPLRLGAHAYRVEAGLDGVDPQHGTETRRETGLEVEIGDRALDRPWARRWTLRAALGRVDVEGRSRPDAPTIDRRLLSLELAGRARQRLGAWSLVEEVDTELAVGRTDDPSDVLATASTGGSTWSRLQGRVRVELSRRAPFARGWRLGLEHTAGRVDDAPVSEWLSVGGRVGSLRSSALAAHRIDLPALPEGALLGPRIERTRVDLGLARSPLVAFAERVRRLAGGAPDGSRLDRTPIELWGVELKLRRGPVPLLRLPAIDLSLGVAFVDEAPREMEVLEDEIEWWLDVRWRP